MKDIAILLQGTTSTIDLNRAISGKSVTVQKCAVNMATSSGSDTLYPDKGTDLLLDLISGSVISEGSAQHITNFATNSTLFFVRENDTDKEALSRTTAITGVITNFSLLTVSLNLDFQFADDTILQVPTSFST